MTWIDLVGYVAAGLLAWSPWLRSVARRRLVSLVALALFAGYGVLIQAWPLVVGMVLLALHRAWSLRRLMSPDHEFKAVEPMPGSPILADFLAAQAQEIRRIQPEWSLSGNDTFIRILMRDGLPAGVFMAEPMGNELLVHLDYVTPRYRDTSIARWLFGDGRNTFTEHGYQRLVTAPTTAEHRHYLEVVGFTREGEFYVKELTG